MNTLIEILTIIFSAIIGACSSGIITILMGRRPDPKYHPFYSIRWYLAIIIFLIFNLVIISLFFN
jgi:hypothetical protein